MAAMWGAYLPLITCAFLSMWRVASRHRRLKDGDLKDSFSLSDECGILSCMLRAYGKSPGPAVSQNYTELEPL